MANELRPTSRWQDFKSFFSQGRLFFWGIGFTFVSFIFIIVVIFVPYLINPRLNLLSELSSPSVARGLITFLISMATVAIAFILTGYAVSDIEGSKENFGKAKEVLTVFVGVLGTIVGFYFGQTSSTPENQAVPVTISNVQVRPDEAMGGDTLIITSEIAGGKAPYDFSIIFKPNDIFKGIESQSSDGKIWEKIIVPDTLKVTHSLEMSIKATDRSGAYAETGTSLKFSIGKKR